MNTIITKKLDTFFNSYSSQTFQKGDIILQPGVEPSGVYYVEAGIVRRYYLSEEGAETTLNLYKPHTFLPMSWAIAGISNNHFYEAMQQVKAKHAPKDAVLTFLHEEPEVVYDLLQRIYIGMEGLWMHMESLTAGNARIKLVASLVILAKRFGQKKDKQLLIQLKMNENDIANYAGLTRETTSRELQKLKQEKLVSFEKGTIGVDNLEKLEEILFH